MLLGIDIGGTFTDIVVSDAGHVRLFKIPSTPQKPAVGVISALSNLIEREVIIPDRVKEIRHGSTVATNALLEGKWARTALVTTHGFRDVLEIGRQDRPKLYDLFFERPAPIVARDQRFEVTERLDYCGKVIKPLVTDDVKRLIPLLREQSVETVAVVFLFSYLDPTHERAVQDVISSALGVPVTISSDILPEFREFERTSTTVISAALRPVIGSYLTSLETGARKSGLNTRWQIMQSNGAITSADYAQTNPARILLSGPAAGVEGARVIGELTGLPDLITLDMGGTSCDVSLIRDGKLSRTTTGQIGDYPVALPMVDIHTIGAGGGSIAWIDHGGALRVGPRSAGADPGPACYDRGGLEPTVTDAHLVLGHLLPSHPLGGLDRLDLDAARSAVGRVASRLNISVEAAALGILEIADAAMERAIRVISVERGYDPRKFSLLAFGGAGPLHAVSVAKRLGISSVIVPATAGVLSAFGLVVAEIGHDFSQGIVRSLLDCKPEMIAGTLAKLRDRAREDLSAEGVKEGTIRFHVSADLRYLGQAHELNVSLLDTKVAEDWAIDQEFMRSIASLFHAEHMRRYGHAPDDQPVELVTLRLRAVGPGLMEVPSVRTAHKSTQGQSASMVKAWFTVDGPVEARVLRRGDIALSVGITGPAIVFGEDATILLPPGTDARIDEYANMILEIA